MSVQGQKGLFAAAPYLSNEARYPRGYTPGRMAEVRDALMRTRTQLARGYQPDTTFTASAVEPPQMDDQMSASSRTRVEALHRRGVNETLARSSVPAEALRSLDNIVTNREHLAQRRAMGLYEPHPRDSDQQRQEQIAKGYYQPPEATPRTLGHGPRVTIGQMRAGDSSPRWGSRTSRRKNTVLNNNESSLEQDTADTLIHEIGHHVSRTEGASGARAASAAERVYTDSRGHHINAAEEAYADDYMIAHRAQSPRDRRMRGPQRPVTYLSSGTVDYTATPYVRARASLLPEEMPKVFSPDTFVDRSPRQDELPFKPTAQDLIRGPSYALNPRQFAGTRGA